MNFEFSKPDYFFNLMNRIEFNDLIKILIMVIHTIMVSLNFSGIIFF